MLSSVGLEQLDHDVYRALLLHPEWGLGQIRQHVGVPEELIRASLDRLTKLSLLIPSARAEHLIPVNPQVSLGPVLEEIRVELAERQAMLSRTQAAVAALTSEYNVARVQAGGDGVERLNGLEAVRIRLMELARQATSEVRAFMPGGALSSAAIEASRPLDEHNLDRGVRMQTIYLESVRNDAATVDYATWFTERGGQIRTVPSLPMRLILCDRSAAVIPVNQQASREGAFIIRLDSVVAALEALFDLLWECAAPLGEPPVIDGDGPSARDLALLKMLEDGLTDEGIGRKLGVSIRTVRRLMADLLKRLNSQSRFQAGVEAARRGWL